MNPGFIESISYTYEQSIYLNDSSIPFVRFIGHRRDEKQTNKLEIGRML